MTVAAPHDPDLSPETLIALAYVGGWTTGVLVWLVERRNVQVRFHAAQAVLLFGGLTGLWIASWVGSFAVLTASAAGFTALQRVSYGVLVAGVLLWAFVLWKVWQGTSWRVPLVAGYADRLAAWRLTRSD